MFSRACALHHRLDERRDRRRRLHHLLLLCGLGFLLAHLEHRFNADTGDKDATAPFFQLSYVGLQGPYGKLTMGRQWNVLFDVVTSTYASFPYSPYMDAYKPELGMAAGAFGVAMMVLAMKCCPVLMNEKTGF